MDYAVFVSHSLAWGDELLFAQLCSQLRRHHGLVCHVARRNLDFGPHILAELEEPIRSTDCVLAIVMNDGTATKFVTQEVDIARAMGKPVIGIAEQSAYISPLFEKIPDLLAISFDLPGDLAAKLYERLLTLRVEQRATAALFWVIMATLGAIYATRE
jgi:hypothetical protein